MSHTIQIIKRGKILGTWENKRAFALHAKFEAQCKKVHQTPIWADHYRAIGRKIDPSYVVFRSKRRKSSDLVLIRLDKAPADYLEELNNIYKWNKG